MDDIWVRVPGLVGGVPGAEGTSMSIMARSLLRILPLVFLLGLTACEYRPVSMQLPSFFTAGIDELWFWRRDEGADTFVRSGHMRLTGLRGPVGNQMLAYTMYSPEGEEHLTCTVPIEVVEDSFVVELWFSRWEEPGTFKVSARNVAGESPLSSGSIRL